MNYTSSIITKYGDSANVNADAKTVADILARQGTSFLIHLIAEQVGHTVNRFKLMNPEVISIRDSLVNELHDAINERT